MGERDAELAEQIRHCRVAFSVSVRLPGDIVAILDSNKNVVVSYIYDAWGRPISKTGSLASTLGTVQPFRYRGYVYDEETGLYYLRSRYYQSNDCRFVNADVLIGLYVLSLDQNQYCYAANSPIILGDEDGLRSQGFFHSAVLKDIVGKDPSLTMQKTMVLYSGGGYGFADLIDPMTGEVWELKRVTMRNLGAASIQLAKYTREMKSTWRYADLFGSEISGLQRGGYRASLLGGVCENGYVGVYAYIGDGIILYDYIKVTDAVTRTVLEDLMRRILDRMGEIQPAVIPVPVTDPRLVPLPDGYSDNQADTRNSWGGVFAVGAGLGVVMAMYCCFGASRCGSLDGLT